MKFLNKLKRKNLFLISIQLILLLYSLLIAKQFPVETHVLWERDCYCFSLCDINGDSVDELIAINDDYCIQPYTQKLNAAAETRMFERGTFNVEMSKCGGLDGNNIWATYKRHDSLFIFNFRLNKSLFVIKGSDQDKQRGWDGLINQVEICDINRDERLEIVVNVIVGYDLKPRGIFVLNWETGKLLWKFLSGPNILSFNILDIDNDGQQEILCGTQAVGNRNIEKETDDLHTYVILLGADGTPRWIKQIGAWSSSVKAQWLKNFKIGSLKIIACEIGNPVGGRKCDSIFLLDALTGQVVKKTQYGEFNRDFVVIKDKNGKPRIIIGGSGDTLRMLDENLSHIRKCCMNSEGIWYIACGQFTGTKENEIAVVTTRGLLLLYDMKFRLLSQFPTPPAYQIMPVRVQNRTRLLVNLIKDDRTLWQLLEFNKIPLLNRRVPIASVILGAIILLLLFSIGMVYARYTKTRDIRTVIRGLTGKSGVIEINQKGDIVNISQRAREILKIDEKDTKVILKKLTDIKQVNPILELAKSMLVDSALSSPQEVVISLSQEQSYLIQCVRVKKGVLITFEDISAVEYMKRVTSWTPVAQKLAHGIKNPLSTILGAVEQMEIKCQENGIKKYIGYVKDEVTKLKKMSDAFMRFTKSASAILEPKNINEIIKKIMAKYEPLWERGVRSEKRGDIKVVYELDEKLPSLNIDEEGISDALNIIIENAIESMSPSPLSSPVKGEEKKRGEILRIKTIPEERLEKEALKQYIKIEVSDTGTGIPEKYLEKVFDPYFTYNKPLGTGLGLTLAKKIIDDHKGYIEVNSKEGVGTQVNIYLPLK